MIITLTLNPAMDRVLILNQFHLNVTNRVQKTLDCIGGKGTHVSANLSLLGIENIATGILRGETGTRIEQTMRTYPLVKTKFLQSAAGCSRTNYVLVENANCTLISERGELLDADSAKQLLSCLAALIQSDDIVVLSGDISNGGSQDIIARILDLIAAKKAKFCLDAYDQALAQALSYRPLLIKPNLDELGMMTAQPLKNEKDILNAMVNLAEQGVVYTMVSCGKSGSYLLYEGQAYRAHVPAVPIHNTVGCGDALVAGMLAGIVRGLPVEACLRYANAVGCAASRCDETVGFDLADVEHDLLDVRVEKLTV